MGHADQRRRKKRKKEKEKLYIEEEEERERRAPKPRCLHTGRRAQACKHHACHIYRHSYLVPSAWPGRSLVHTADTGKCPPLTDRGGARSSMFGCAIARTTQQCGSMDGYALTYRLPVGAGGRPLPVLQPMQSAEGITKASACKRKKSHTCMYIPAIF